MDICRADEPPMSIDGPKQRVIPHDMAHDAVERILDGMTPIEHRNHRTGISACEVSTRRESLRFGLKPQSTRA
jgi:hypothetical protein